MNDEIKRIIKYWANWAITRLPTCVYDFEDLENEGIVLYYELIDQFDGDQDDFKYFFERALLNKMHKLVRYEYYRRHSSIPSNLSVKPTDLNDPENSDWLSEEAKEILPFVMELAVEGQIKRIRQQVRRRFGLSPAKCNEILWRIGNAL